MTTTKTLTRLCSLRLEATLGGTAPDLRATGSEYRVLSSSGTPRGPRRETATRSLGIRRTLARNSSGPGGLSRKERSCTRLVHTLHKNFGPSLRDQQAAATQPSLEAQWCVTPPDALNDNTSNVAQAVSGNRGKQADKHASMAHLSECLACWCCCSRRAYIYWSVSLLFWVCR